jgi:hypothetical protein
MKIVAVERAMKEAHRWKKYTSFMGKYFGV